MASPLYDYYDPYGILRDQAKRGQLPDGERRDLTLTDLIPEEERQSKISWLANAGASGLAGLGWILDTPGSLVRGTISGLMEGDPLKGARTLLGRSDERVSGRDLFRQMGIVGPEDTWANWGGSIVGEALLDPLTYLNPLAVLGRGALGPAGRAAGRASLLDDVALRARNAGMGTREYMLSRTPGQLTADVGGGAWNDFATAARGKGLDPDELLDQPLASLAEFRIPGFERGVPVSLGQTADRAIARTLDNVGIGLSENPLTGPLVNRVTAAFDPSVMGRVNPDEQWRAREAFAGAIADDRDLRERAAAAMLSARNAGAAIETPELQRAVVDSIENITPERRASMAPQSRLAIDLLENVPEWRGYRDFLQDEIAGRTERLAALGVKTPRIQSDLGFFPRQQVIFESPRKPEIAENLPRGTRPYERGNRLFSVNDVVGESRRPYLENLSREQVRRLMTGERGARLRDDLFAAAPNDIPEIIDAGAADIGVQLPYDTAPDGQTIQNLQAFLADESLTASERAGPLRELQELQRRSRQMKTELGGLFRTVDRQFADSGRGLFDRDTAADILRYGSGGARSEANARVVTESLVNAASDIPAGELPGGGYINLLEAAGTLGFDRNRLEQVLAARPDMAGRDVASLSVPERLVGELGAIAPRTQAAERGPLGRAYDSFTNIFKALALATPAYHARNLYSGYLSSLTAGGMNPISLAQSMRAGLEAGKGNFDPVIARLREAPRYQHLEGQELLDEFRIGAARNELGQGLVMESEEGVANAARNLLVGDGQPGRIPWVGERGLLYDPNRSWEDWATVRGVNFRGALDESPTPARTLNPLLDLHERTGRRVEDALRIGTYIEGLRQGMTPDAAADLVRKAQVDYRPQAFTEFERGVKRYVPFYSYNRGIAPLVVENLLYRPGGIQGQITRAVSAGSRPSDESFLPEDLRSSTAIQLPGMYGEEGNLVRYLNNIDLPWRGLVDMITPGIGNTPFESFSDGVQKTGMNLLGQLNPAFKAPLEMLMDRQLYSGRQLSDVYSMLEKDIGPVGRTAEQIIANLPGGSRAMGIIRTARDERLSPAERAAKILINQTSGFKITDRDPERAESKAVRDVATQLLRRMPGVRSYESLSVKEEDLAKMTPEQRDIYLLYRSIQSEAAKRARERKKAESALDLLGVN